MDIGEVFRRFFGIPSYSYSYRPREPDFPNLPSESERFHPEERNFEDDGCYDDNENIEFFFESPGNKNGLDGMFEHFNGGIFAQMEQLHRQMDDMMRGFGAINFPPVDNIPSLPPNSPPSADKNEDSRHGNGSIWFGNRSPFSNIGSSEKPNSPRDFMLKDGENDTEVSDPTPSKKLPKIGPIYTPGKPEKIQDSDLDGSLSDHDILSLVKPQVDTPRQQQPLQPRQHQPAGFFSSSSSVSFSSFTGADGKVEKKKVVRDSTGREETTVTRSLGDQSHSVTTVTNQDGSQEKHETFQNMDEKDVGSFENVWNSPSQKPRNHPADQLVQPNVMPRIDLHDQDLFSKLFGFGGRK